MSPKLSLAYSLSHTAITSLISFPSHAILLLLLFLLLLAWCTLLLPDCGGRLLRLHTRMVDWADL